MKSIAPLLAWVSNLYELGGPIRRATDDIQRRQRDIARLWTPEEIAAAKRGFMLVDGKEIRLQRSENFLPYVLEA